MCEHNSTERLYSHFGKEVEVHRGGGKKFGTPRVSIVQEFTPVLRGRVCHPPVPSSNQPLD
jgi:hypothetical protein